MASMGGGRVLLVVVLAFLVSDPVWADVSVSQLYAQQATSLVQATAGSDGCEIGKYFAREKCIPCVKGWTTPGAGGVGQEACSICAAGYFMGGGVCQECPAGKSTASSGATALDACSECGMGWFAIQPDHCAPCEYGRFSNTTGATECTECAMGHYATGMATECTECGSGKYSDILGATECTECPERTDFSGTGGTECYDLDNIPSWYMETFNTMLLFVTVTALSLGATTNKTAIPVVLLFILVSVVMFLLGTPTAGAYDYHSPSHSQMQTLASVIAAGVVLATVYDRMTGHKLEGLRRFRGGLRVFWALASLALVVVTEWRLQIPPKRNREWDMHLTLAIFVLIQVELAYVIEHLHDMGNIGRRTPVVYIFALYLFAMGLPYYVVRAGLYNDDRNWETQDYTNVWFANGVFGLFAAGAMLVVRALSTLKGSHTKAVERAKTAFTHMQKLDKAAEGLQCGSGFDRSDWRVSKAQSAVLSTLNEIGSWSMSDGTGTLMCRWLDRCEARLGGSLAALHPFVGQLPQVEDRDSRVVGRDYDYEKLGKECASQLDAATQAEMARMAASPEDVDAWSCPKLKTAVVQLREVVSQHLEKERKLTIPERAMSYFLDEKVTEMVTSQLLIATGFYGSVTSMAGMASTIRKNFSGAHDRLLTTVGVFLAIMGLAVFFWMGGALVIPPTTQANRLLTFKQPFSKYCSPRYCGPGKFFSFDCNGSGNGCSECGPQNCDKGETFHHKSCGSKEDVTNSGCV